MAPVIGARPQGSLGHHEQMLPSDGAVRAAQKEIPVLQGSSWFLPVVPAPEQSEEYKYLKENLMEKESNLFQGVLIPRTQGRKRNHNVGPVVAFLPIGDFQ